MNYHLLKALTMFTFCFAIFLPASEIFGVGVSVEWKNILFARLRLSGNQDCYLCDLTSHLSVSMLSQIVWQHVGRFHAVWKPGWNILECQLNLSGNHRNIPGSFVDKILTPVLKILQEGRSWCGYSIARHFKTSWTLAHQAPLSSTISHCLLKFMSIESVTPSNHRIFCCPLLLVPSIFPSIRVSPKILLVRSRYD